jgi:endonuclease YncB( thermonuclease family)
MEGRDVLGFGRRPQQKRAAVIVMKPIDRMAALVWCASLLTGAPDRAIAAPCLFEPIGEGRVTDVVDGRSFRLDDGREIRLAGIETDGMDKTALAAMLSGHDVTLRGADDAPDRYGRQVAFAFLAASEVPVQNPLLAHGDALVSVEIIEKDCAAALAAAEAEARRAHKGIWNDSNVIKNAESSGDILAGIGRFTIVEGKVLSVRQAGATTYLNFGRNWTRDFAATISRRAMPAIEAVGIASKSLENRKIRVRGWVEGRPGPRIDVQGAAQIEILGEN